MSIQKEFKLWLMLMFFMPLFLTAQMVTKNALILNGGAYTDPDDFVTLATYDPETQITQTIATIYTQSVQGMLVHDGYAFVAAQDSLAKVDIESGEITSIIALSGVNKFAVYNDFLIVSRQFPVTSGFVQVRQIEDLSLVTTFDEVSDEAWEITVVGDTAYVSVAGGWAATEGKIAVLDMKNISFVREVNLGGQAIGIGPSFAHAENLFFVCKTPWGGTSGTIVKYNLISSSWSFHQSGYAFGKAAGIADEKLYLLINGNVGTIDLNTVSVIDEDLIVNPFTDLDITALTLDTISQQIYVNYSYWVAPNGTGKVYNLNGLEVGGYEVGISAEEVAVNYTDVTGVPRHTEQKWSCTIFPNPSVEQLNITGLPPGSIVKIYNCAGECFLSVPEQRYGSQIDVSALLPGIYIIKVLSQGEQQVIKFIHQ
jgi:hypothetical protein